MENKSSSEILTASPGIFTAQIEIQRSKFIAWASRADNELAARELINDARNQYPDARHHCSAFVFKDPELGDVSRSNDDGEPAGTAGRPMLEALQSSQYSNICVVVIRYFGGILLGTGGLVRAYSTSTCAALDKIKPLRLITTQLCSFHCPISAAGKLESTLRGSKFTITDIAWGKTAHFTVALNTQSPDSLSGIVNQSLGQNTPIEKAGTKQIELPL